MTYDLFKFLSLIKTLMNDKKLRKKIDCYENENGVPSFNIKTINKIYTNNYADKCGEFVTEANQQQQYESDGDKQVCKCNNKQCVHNT